MIEWAKVSVETLKTGQNYEIWVSLEDASDMVEEIEQEIRDSRLRIDFGSRLIHDTINDTLKEGIFCKIAKEKSDNIMNIIRNYVSQIDFTEVAVPEKQPEPRRRFEQDDFKGLEDIIEVSEKGKDE